MKFILNTKENSYVPKGFSNYKVRNIFSKKYLKKVLLKVFEILPKSGILQHTLLLAGRNIFYYICSLRRAYKLYTLIYLCISGKRKLNNRTAFFCCCIQSVPF